MWHCGGKSGSSAALPCSSSSCLTKASWAGRRRQEPTSNWGTNNRQALATQGRRGLPRPPPCVPAFFPGLEQHRRQRPVVEAPHLPRACWGQALSSIPRLFLPSRLTASDLHCWLFFFLQHPTDHIWKLPEMVKSCLSSCIVWPAGSIVFSSSSRYCHGYHSATVSSPWLRVAISHYHGDHASSTSAAASQALLVTTIQIRELSSERLSRWLWVTLLASDRARMLT